MDAPAAPDPTSPDLPHEDLIGKHLGDYTLLRRLGRGGMANVYLARQHSLERNVALKILKPELAKDASYVRRFHREAQAAATLVQANIVQIYEVNKIDGLHFIAQEYVRGRNLRQFIERHGAVAPVIALTVLRQCALALQKAETFHIVHRDIKPENIMLSTTGEVKVTDFGLARVNDDAAKQALTQIGVTMGTPLYMSPEQVEGLRLDARSDIYSLGVTAYHMLAGHAPFDGENALAIAVKQVKETAPPLQEIRPDIPIELCQIIHQMIEKDPNDRPQNTATLIKQLRKIKLDDEEDWDLLIEQLATNDTTPLATTSPSQSRLAATQQLQAVIRGDVRPWWRHPATIAAAVLLSILGIVTGSLIALSTPPPFPLDVEGTTANAIPRKADVVQQYNSAYWGTYALGPDQQTARADYWKAVIDYFPLSESSDENRNKTKLYHRRAQARLGEVYLSQHQWDKALEIYEQLENDRTASDHFRVTGTAGKAIIYDLRPPETFSGGVAEKEQVIRQCLSKIGSQSELLNEFMRTALAKIKERYPSPTAPQEPTLLPGEQTPPQSIRATTTPSNENNLFPPFPWFRIELPPFLRPQPNTQ